MKKILGALQIGKLILIVVVSAIILRYFVFQPFIVDGASMEPNYSTNEYIVVNKLGYRLHLPNRGDVIVFRYPNNPAVNYIKRIIALPGEEIKIENGSVYVDGQLLAEKYLASDEKTYVNNISSDSQAYIKKLGTDEYFVMGDNRSHSSDSRDWGVLKKEYIIGRSAIVLYRKAADQTAETSGYLP